MWTSDNTSKKKVKRMDPFKNKIKLKDCEPNKEK